MPSQMADLWLGFERDDIHRWFAEAELKDIDVDCAEGTCNACGPDGTVKPLSIFCDWAESVDGGKEAT